MSLACLVYLKVLARLSDNLGKQEQTEKKLENVSAQLSQVQTNFCKRGNQFADDLERYFKHVLGRIFIYTSDLNNGEVRFLVLVCFLVFITVIWKLYYLVKFFNGDLNYRNTVLWDHLVWSSHVLKTLHSSRWSLFNLCHSLYQCYETIMFGRVTYARCRLRRERFSVYLIHIL